jgi:hypothetical protein
VATREETRASAQVVEDSSTSPPPPAANASFPPPGIGEAEEVRWGKNVEHVGAQADSERRLRPPPPLSHSLLVLRPRFTSLVRPGGGGDGCEDDRTENEESSREKKGLAKGEEGGRKSLLLRQPRRGKFPATAFASRISERRASERALILALRILPPPSPPTSPPICGGGERERESEVPLPPSLLACSRSARSPPPRHVRSLDRRRERRFPTSLRCAGVLFCRLSLAVFPTFHFESVLKD